jgi:hypothetical protein
MIAARLGGYRIRLTGLLAIFLAVSYQPEPRLTAEC